jgi:hypothetical protein
MRALHRLRAEEPFRVPVSDLDLDNKLPAHIGRIEFLKSCVKPLIAAAWIPDGTLSQCVVETEEIESDDRTSRSFQ